MNRRPVSAQELTEYPPSNPNARLLSPKPASNTDEKSKNRNSRFQDLLRHVRLLLPGTLFKYASTWRSPIERRKVAVYQSRPMAALISILHMIPFLGALALLVLFWTKHWIGPDFADATALQFVAKLHEMFMQASLLDILLYIIRAQALGGFVPLGALSGAAQAPQISYLWSLDFIAALGHSDFKLRPKVLFGLTTVGLLLMTSVVGPSSAVLMIPRAGMSHINETINWYSHLGPGVMFPTIIDNTSPINISRAFRDYYQTTDQLGSTWLGAEFTMDGMLFSKYIWSPGPTDGSSTTLRVALMQHEGAEPWDTARYSTTIIVPTTLSLRLLQYYALRRSDRRSSTDWTIQVPQPTTTIKCTDRVSSLTMQSGVWAGHMHYIKDDGTNSTLPNAIDLLTKMNIAPTLDTHEFWDNLTENTLMPYYNKALWVESPGDSPSILYIQVEKSYYTMPLTVQVCTIAAFWRTTTTILNYNKTGVLVFPATPRDQADFMEGSQAITFNPEGLALLNSYISYDSSAYLAEIPRILPLALATMEYDGHGQTMSAWTDEDEQARLSSLDSTTKFKVVSTRSGYGYGATDTSAWLALTVVTAYCAIVALYVTYVMSTGRASIAWDSATELILLALQSQAPDHLGHVSVGADSIATFRKNVGIRVNTVSIKDTGELQEKLELVFEDDERVRNEEFQKVIQNQAY